MDAIEARVLIKNLLKRLRAADDGDYRLEGLVTDDEVAAIKFAAAALDSATPSAVADGVPESPQSAPEKQQAVQSAAADVHIDLSTLSLPAPEEGKRLCLDFGTAMSKVTMVQDAGHGGDYEIINVLNLGVPGDQEEVSERMLVSSVYIDAEGILWFGQAAVARSKLESKQQSRQRLDNIKRYLSEEGFDSPVGALFNPTDIVVTYGDMILAYLTFLTWAVSECLQDEPEARNMPRRFAMPCFGNDKRRHVETCLTKMLGEAQILADTFGAKVSGGLPLKEFMAAVTKVRSVAVDYPFILEGLTEPLGVAGSIMSWTDEMEDFQTLLMVIDVGAGTSDFSMFQLSYNKSTGKSVAREVENSQEGITEAGNYLDKLLSGLILRKAGVNSEHPDWIRIQGNLELELRNYKESLFREEEIAVRLLDGSVVSVLLSEFLELPQVVQFGESLKGCRDRILTRINQSFLGWARLGRVAVALTGGGAALPMVSSLASGHVSSGSYRVDLVPAKAFPEWLAAEYPDLEADYPRISVSLGGARKQVPQQGRASSTTAGDVKGTPVLGGFYTKGQ